MQGNEIGELHMLLPSNSSQYHDHHLIHHPCSSSSYGHPAYELSRLYEQLQSSAPQVNISQSRSSTSDEADEQQLNLSIIKERKQRRMISNRESARRSRMRKQKHLDELWSQVVWLRNENHQLIHKLNHASESHDLLLQENAHLKQQASELRQMLHLTTPFPPTLTVNNNT